MIRIRKGTVADIDAIMSCYNIARQYMRASGNHSQWINGYPSPELVAEDIAEGVSYVGVDDSGEVVMAFAFIIGDDPTYSVIEAGRWLNDLPYGTIHRLGSTGKHRGILKLCVDFCFSQIDNIRLDTHSDNATMQKAAEKLGFARCGTIYCTDGSPRVAFQKKKDCRHRMMRTGKFIQPLKDWLGRLSFRTGVIVTLACIPFYILSFAQMALPISVTAKGILWVVLFGMAKTAQYGGLTILGVEGIRRLKAFWKRSQH